jgi:putative Mn2+ efflux pump MntP
MTGFMMATAEEASLRYSATSTLVLGIIAIFVAFFLGGLSILAIIFAAVSGQRGIKSRTRREQAIAGLVLTGIAVVIFVLSLVLRYVVKL